MIHLFNEVFIEQDSRITILPPNQNAQLVESLYDVCVISDKYTTKDLKSNPAVIYQSPSIEQLLEENEWADLKDFLDVLMGFNRKIVIYASNSVMATIVATVLKSLTNMEQKQFDTYVDIYEWRNVTNSKHYGDLCDLMKSAFTTAETYDYSTAYFTPSYEFCLASAFIEPNFRRRDKLVNLLSKFIKREYEDVILEVRKHIDSLILDQDVQELLGGTEYISKPDLSTIKTLLPALQIYKEPYFIEELYGPIYKAYRPGSFARGETKLNIALCTQTELQQLCDLSENLLHLITNIDMPKEQITKMFESRGFPFKEAVSTGDCTLSYEDYLVALNEIIDEKYNLIHVPLDLREYIMIHIIPYFKSLKNQGNLEELAKYTLK